MVDGQRLSFEDLRQVPANGAVVDWVEGASAHSDVAEVLVRYARGVGDLTVLAVGQGECPALVAARPGGEIVVFASGMRSLGLRVTSTPDHPQLKPETRADLGPAWWILNPFAADVTIADTATELRDWFGRLA